MKMRFKKGLVKDTKVSSTNPSKRFLKGQLTEESYDVIMFDLGMLQSDMLLDNKVAFKKRYKLLQGNLKDIWGRK